MSKYTFGALVTISVSTTVEADSEEEALDIAEGRDMQGLCHYCARSKGDFWSTSGELDGTAVDISLDEVEK